MDSPGRTSTVKRGAIICVGMRMWTCVHVSTRTHARGLHPTLNTQITPETEVWEDGVATTLQEGIKLSLEFANNNPSGIDLAAFAADQVSCEYIDMLH